MQDAPPPAPRPFRFQSLPIAVIVKVILGGILSLNGVSIALVFTLIGGPFWNDSLLDDRGVERRVTPTHVEPTGSRVNNERVYEIHYIYTAADGSTQSGVVSSRNDSTLEAARAKDALTIEYDPERPAVSRIKGESASVFGLFTLIPVATALIGLAILLSGLPGVRRIRAIYVNGTPAKAKVLAVASTMARVNGRTVMRIDYEFQSVLGPVKGTSSSTIKPEIGSEIWILHDPMDPAANVAA